MSCNSSLQVEYLNFIPVLQKSSNLTYSNICSHLHVNITARFLRCDPNFEKKSYYLEESTRFYKNPMIWLDREYPLSDKTILPTHLICFDVLVPFIETFLTTRGYKKWLQIFHGDFVPRRIGHYIIIYNKTAPSNFQY